MFGPSVADPEPHGSKITCQIRPLAALLVFIFRTCILLEKYYPCWTVAHLEEHELVEELLFWWVAGVVVVVSYYNTMVEQAAFYPPELSPHHTGCTCRQRCQKHFEIYLCFHDTYNIFLFSQPTNAKGVNIFMVIYTVLQCNLPPITPHWEAETHLLRPAHLLPAYLHCRSYNLHACNTPIFVPYSKCLHSVTK